MDGAVGGPLPLPGGLGPAAAQFEDREGLVRCRLDEVIFGLGEEAGRAGDLLDLYLGKLPLPHRLLGRRETDQLTGGLQGVDGRSDPGSADLSDVGRSRAVTLRAPDVGGLDPSSSQELPTGGQLLEVGESVEQLRGIGAGETLRVQIGQHVTQLVGQSLEGGEHHGQRVPSGCITAR